MVKQYFLSIDVGILNLALCLLDDSGTIHEWKVLSLLDGDQALKCGCKNASGTLCTRKAAYRRPISQQELSQLKKEASKRKRKFPTHTGCCKQHHQRAASSSEPLLWVRNATVANTTDSELREQLFRVLATFVSSSVVCTGDDDDDIIVDVLIERQPRKASEKMKSAAMAIFDFFTIMKVGLLKLEPRGVIASVEYVSAKHKLCVYDGPALSCKYKTQYKRNKWFSERYCEHYLEKTNQLAWLQKRDTNDGKVDDYADCLLQGVYIALYERKKRAVPISSEHQKLVFSEANLHKLRKMKRGRRATAKQLKASVGKFTLSNVKHALCRKQAGTNTEDDDHVLQCAIPFYFAGLATTPEELQQHLQEEKKVSTLINQ